MNEMNSIDNMNTWEDIEKNIRCFYRNPQNDFIILKKVNEQYLLLSDEDVNKLKPEYCKCYLLPYYCLGDINYHTSFDAFNGFNSHAKYYIIKYLYRYRKENHIYKLLLFTNAIYHIIKNDCYHWFKRCKNYDKNFLKDALKNMLKICEDEIYKRTKIEHRYIYGQTKRYFSPIEELAINYEYINKDIDISNINAIIDYISLIIQEVKTQYRFIAVYSDPEEQIRSLLKSM